MNPHAQSESAVPFFDIGDSIEGEQDGDGVCFDTVYGDGDNYGTGSGNGGGCGYEFPNGDGAYELDHGNPGKMPLAPADPDLWICWNVEQQLDSLIGL